MEWTCKAERARKNMKLDVLFVYKVQVIVDVLYLSKTLGLVILKAELYSSPVMGSKYVL